MTAFSIHFGPWFGTCVGGAITGGFYSSSNVQPVSAVKNGLAKFIHADIPFTFHVVSVDLGEPIDDINSGIFGDSYLTIADVLAEDGAYDPLNALNMASKRRRQEIRAEKMLTNMAPSVLAEQAGVKLRVYTSLFDREKVSRWFKDKIFEAMEPQRDEPRVYPQTAELPGLEALNDEILHKRVKGSWVSKPCSLAILFHACHCPDNKSIKDKELNSDLKLLAQPLLDILKEHRKLLAFLWVSSASLGCDKCPLLLTH